MRPTEDDPDTTSHGVTSRGSRGSLTFAWLVLILALSAGIYLRNPAVALLGGLSVRLVWRVNPLPPSATLGKYSLQGAIVLLGLTLGFDRMLDVSAQYGWIVAGYIATTLTAGWIFAKSLRGDPTEQTLLTSGTAICGGTAIATLAPLVGAKPHQFAVTTALVFLLNVVALLTFPAIGHWLQMSQESFGAWVALAVHDTSSVVATAALYGSEAAEVATTVKLGRTLWLIPLAFAVSLIYGNSEAKLRVPGFVLLFVLAAVGGSLLNLPEEWIQTISWLSKTLLVLALGMIGLEIERSTLRQMSLKSLLFGIGLWVVVAPVAWLLVIYT